MRFDHRPIGYFDYQYRDTKQAKIQLITEVLIGCDEQIKADGLSRREQLSVQKLGPSALSRSFNLMCCKPGSER
jgi:hypothetical protein